MSESPQKIEQLKSLLVAGEACIDKADYEGALERFDAFCEQEVRVSYVWKCRGECLIGTGKYKEAAVSLKEAIRLDPQSEEAWGYLAYASALLGEKALALHMLEKAEGQVRRKDILAYFRGRLNERIGNDTEALFDYVRIQTMSTTKESKDIGARSAYRVLNKKKE